MSKIRILSDALASQVAAGEVVERPAAVVRELVENSLDAGATHIEVAVQRGGSSLIRISDNGSGMGREDAMLSIERHATSKIRAKEDLAAISTFGFRGEALPSIASVSRFRLVTREASALEGTEIEINGGKLVAVRGCGCGHGTSIEARSLFYNVPARRKFLRTEATEFSHVEHQFRMHAIANPQVAFTLSKDDEVIYHLPATHEVIERIRGLVGDELAQRLLPVIEAERFGIVVSGYIGGPGFSRNNRTMQVVFLNGRPIESSAISYGMREGYHTTLMKGQYPVTFLFLRMDPHAFDINVHPAKKEVRFHDSQIVREAVARAIQDTLNHTRSLPQGHPTSPRAFATGMVSSSGEQVDQPVLPLPAQELTALRRDWAEFQPSSRELSGSSATIEIDSASTNSGQQIQRVAPVSAGTKAAMEPVQADAPSHSPSTSPSTRSSGDEAEGYRIMGVLNKLYVLMESKDGLVLMDQHAAHERVLFEKMRRSMETEGVPTQRLLLPLMLHVSPRDYDLLSRNLPALSKLGIEAEAFGSNTFKVDSLPSFMATDDPLHLLNEVVEELSSLSSRASSLRLGEDMIATTVCRHAVKANDYLREPELRGLLRDLFACEMPFCCPHGRPTLIEISYPELDRKFGRRAP